MKRVLTLVVAVLLALAVAGCSGDDDTAAPTTTGAPTTRATTGTGTCKPAKRPKPREPKRYSAPTAHLSGLKTYNVIVETNCGSFTIRLDTQMPSRSVVSFAKLVRAGFFDNTVFHRIVPNFVIQGGDPTQEGSGGPGYRTIDAPPSTARYTKGVVAMAKTPDELPGTAGSQFFVVTADDAKLPPDYAIIGRVTNGLHVVERIGRRATKEDEHGHPIPSPNPVVIRKMRLKAF